MKISRIEKHVFINNNEMMNICHLSKNLYNYGLFITRQLYFGILDNIPEELLSKLNYRYDKYNAKIKYYIDKNLLINYLTKSDNIDYRSIPAQSAQQTIILLYKNWKSYFQSLKEYFKDPKKFKNKPKPPKYKKKNGYFVCIFPGQNLRINDNGYLRFPKKTNIKPIKTLVDSKQLQHVRVVPHYGHTTIEIVYEKENNYENFNLDNDLYMSIDLGINNLITTSNNAGLKPFIINGKIVKSINQYFNKKKAKLQSYVGNDDTSKKLEKLHAKRKFKIEDYFHKTSKYIIDYCVNNNIKNIVIGYNQDWKQNANMGKKNNQKFICIPYLKLIKMIEYKAFDVGIKVICHEEAYTSKCDALSCEKICKHSEYLGKRLKRGLFQSGCGKIINSDINGALNILRKVIGDVFIENQLIEGLVFNPLRIDI